jgi:hypothetical protein
MRSILKPPGRHPVSGKHRPPLDKGGLQGGLAGDLFRISPYNPSFSSQHSLHFFEGEHEDDDEDDFRSS